MADSPVHVIVNPWSSGGRTGRNLNAYRRVVEGYFPGAGWTLTEAPGHAVEVTRRLLGRGVELILAVGGDGTLNEIVNGYLTEDGGPVNPAASIGLVPAGTGSDFGRLLGIPHHRDGALRYIAESTAKTLDLGRLTIHSPGSGEKSGEKSGETPAPVESVPVFDRYFINTADFGFGAEVVARVGAKPGGKQTGFSYYLGILTTMSNFHSRRVRVVLDSGEEILGKYLLGAVSNGVYFGGGMKIAPQALPDDGYFELVLIGEMGLWEIIRNTRRLYGGTIGDHPRVSMHRVRRVCVYPHDTGPPLAVEYDGEWAGRVDTGSWLEFRIVPRGVRIRVRE